jgi:hypothetical protein
MYVSDKGDERCGGQQSDAGDGTEAYDDGDLPGDSLKFSLGLAHAGFQLADFPTYLVQTRSQSVGDDGVGIFHKR